MCGAEAPREPGDRKERGSQVFTAEEEGAGEDGVRIRLSLIPVVGPMLAPWLDRVVVPPYASKHGGIGTPSGSSHDLTSIGDFDSGM